MLPSYAGRVRAYYTGHQNYVVTPSPPHNKTYYNNGAVLRHQLSRDPSDKEDVEVDEADKSWFDILSTFSQETSLHGVRYTTLETSFVVIRRLAWMLLIGTALGIFVYYSYERVGVYLQYDTVSSVSEKYVPTLSFPAVTICNQNPFQLTAANAQGWYPLANDFTSGDDVYTQRSCYADEMTCDNQDCVPLEYQCDGFPDCTDGSDETYCNPCPRLVIAGNVSLADLDSIISEVYTRQDSTFHVTHPVYVGDDSNTYLYYDTTLQEWTFGNSVFVGPNLLSASDAAGTPQNVTSHWTLASSGDAVQLSFGCAPPDLTPSVLAPPADTSLSLQYIFDNGAQPLSQLVMGCLWKGDPCPADSFKTVYTDMGVCYTFELESMTVEGAGPGTGMTVMLNTEQYEYTSDPADGAGVQILTHAPEDIPVMSRGLAVSPGLISMVALERTQVENEVPPWGTCETGDLDYYDVYSVNTCTNECETDIARAECGCLDIDMPVGNGDVPYCTVAEYNDCLEIEITDSVVSQQCSCGTPCSDTVYVNSLSFASISTDESSINTQDAETAELQRRMANAREVSYRVDTNKFRGTARVINIMDTSFHRYITFYREMRHQLQETQAELVTVSKDAATDCIALNMLQLEQAQQFSGDVMRVLNRYQSFYTSATYANLLNFRDVMASLMDPFLTSEEGYLDNHATFLEFTQVEAQIALTDVTLSVRNISIWTDLNNGTYYNADFDVQPTDSILNATSATVSLPAGAFWNVTTDIWVRLVSLRTTYQQVQSSLNASAGPLFAELNGAISAINDTGYALKEVLLDPLLPSIRLQCSWCANADNETLASIVKTRLATFSEGTLLPTLEQMSVDLLDLYNGYLVALAQEDSAAQSQVVDVDLPNLISSADSLSIAMEQELYETLNTANEFVLELFSRIDPKCQDDLFTSQREIIANTGLSLDLIAEILVDVNEQYGNFHNSSTSYIDGSATLAELAQSVPFTELLGFQQPRASSAQDFMRLRSNLVTSLQNNVNNIFYWLLMQWDEAYLVSSSSYWSTFSITTPGVLTPTSTPVLGDYKEMLAYSIEDSVQSVEFFTNQVQDLAETVTFIEYYYSSLSMTGTEAQNYFDAFLALNSIGAEFYEKNILQLDVFYKALTDKSISEVRAYDFASLLGELGGILGLLLGASSMTIMEFFDMFCYNCCLKCCRGGKRKRNRRTRPRNGPAESFAVTQAKF